MEQLNFWLWIITMILIPFTLYRFSEHDIFFTRLKSGNIKFIIKGETLIKMIWDIEGKIIVWNTDNGWKLTKGTINKNFLVRWLGIWWIGIPPSKIHKFLINKEKENPKEEETSDKWIISGGEKEVDSLRFAFPRPFLFKKVELKDRTTVDILAVCKFEAVDPYKLIFILKADFFEIAGSLLSSEINDKVAEIGDITQFIEKPKGGKDGLLFEKLLKPKIGEEESEFNKHLMEVVGLKLVDINIAKFDPSDRDVLAATNRKAIATLEGDAKIEKATKEAEALNITTEADARRIEKLGKAQGVRVKEVVANLASALGNKDIVTESAGNILKAEAIASSPHIHTYVEGGGKAGIVIPSNEGGGK